MKDDSYRPVWIELSREHEPDRELCLRGDHTWVAAFLTSGRLAYWQCEGCGKRDREIDLGFESTGYPCRLDQFSGWIDSPPVLVARGAMPPVSARRWMTAEGMILVEGDPSSIHFVGVVIPGLVEAHTYRLCDETGAVEALYEPARKQPWQYTDHYWLTRYQVVGDSLVRFEVHCYEDSTYEMPNTSEPDQTAILSGLRLLSE